MASITPPEPEIILYKTGFEPDTDLLGRAETGNSLSELVMRIDDPMVIALDGGWGSGKSFFLKCWVGAHLKGHGATSQTVYFDAFEHDFIDTPLVSLLTRMAERFPHLTADNRTRFDKVKTAAGKLVPAVLRMTAHLATLGASKHLEDTGDAMADIVGGEIANSADNIWEQAEQQHNAMEDFRTALTELTNSDDNSKKLIIVIDELDRCRPDYALSLLEIIKHFFAVPNVHFVLGVNMKQLENSVHARYGIGIDAGLYLQKFVGLTMHLPTQTPQQQQNSINLLYFERQAERMQLDSAMVERTRDSIRCLVDQSAVSLRSLGRTLSLLALIRHETIHPLGAFQFVLSSLIALKVHAGDTYNLLRKSEAGISDLQKSIMLDFKDPKQGNRLPYLHGRAWAHFLDQGRVNDRHGWANFDPGSLLDNPDVILANLIQNTLETFTLPYHKG